MTCFAIKNMALTFTFMTRSQSSSLRSRTEARRMMPALLKRMCTAPKACSAAATTRRQSASFVTSAPSKTARPPASVMTWAVSCPAASLISVDDDGRAFAGEELRGGAAYAGGTAGDDRCLVVECAHVGGRIHDCVSARGPWAETPGQACAAACGHEVLRLRSASPLFAQDDKGFWIDVATS